MYALKRSFLGALCTALSLALVNARAAEPAGDSCSDACRPTGLIARSWQPASVYPSSLVPSSWAAAAAETRALRPDPMLAWQPPNTHWLAKLRGMRELRLLTLWESDAARLFLGISESGVPGIAISSRRPPPRARRASSHANTWAAVDR